jgi:histidinol-phosphate aminotransferase
MVRPIPATQSRSLQTSRPPIRLDLLDNPYGPSMAVLEALSAPSDGRGWAGGEQPSSARLRRALSRYLEVPLSWLLVTNGIDELLDALYLWRRDQGPLVLFPPSNPSEVRRAAIHRVPVVTLQRTAAFALDLDLETVADLPPGCWAIVQSPNDPTGTLLDPLDAVRLARACEVLVIDERHGAYAGRSLLPLVREFENIVLVQTMETWAGLRSFPVAYAMAPPGVLSHLGACLGSDEIPLGNMSAAVATLSDLAHVQLTIHRVRQERSRLYRMLRKLNMVTPCPSWGNFLPVRVERGSANEIVSGLAEHGIRVHLPPQSELATMLRISAGFPEHSDALKQALIAIGREL